MGTRVSPSWSVSCTRSGKPRGRRGGSGGFDPAEPGSGAALGPSENMRRKVGHDTSDAGHRNTRAVLTPEMVDTMFVLYQEQRKTMREIAEMFSVSRTTVSRTLHGQRYTTRAVSEVYSAHDRGTHAVNPRYGEDNPRSKLTKAQAEAIRADSRPRREVAAEYGISLTHVTGKNWSV